MIKEKKKCILICSKNNISLQNVYFYDGSLKYSDFQCPLCNSEVVAKTGQTWRNNTTLIKSYIFVKECNCFGENNADSIEGVDGVKSSVVILIKFTQQKLDNCNKVNLKWARRIAGGRIAGGRIANSTNCSVV